MEVRKMYEEDCRYVYTLNTWRAEQKAEAKNYLEEGLWVHLGSTAIGHTRAAITEQAGIKWATEEYGDVLQIAQRAEDGMVYIRLR